MGYEIEFANRTWELDEICRPGGAKFILVDAPAGYGKSFLLREVKETFEARGDWVVVLVDLKSKPDMSSDRVEVARAAIANEIARQVERDGIAYPDMDEYEVLFAINDLLQSLAKKVLLLLDGIEALPLDTSSWLRNMIGELDNAFQTAGREFRAVLAGRYIRDWGKRAGFSLRLLKLSPFDLEIIQPIVYNALKRSKLASQNIDRTFVDALAMYTLWISGGHPKGICGIVSEIEKLASVPPALEFFFFCRVFQIDRRSGTMFDLYVEPIVEEILEEAIPEPLTVRDAMETISVFRKFNPDILDILISDGKIQGFESGWTLLQELMKTHLVDTPNMANPMYSDDIVRRMLTIRLQIKKPNRYKQLNKRARKIFCTWAQGQKIEGLPEDGDLDIQVRLVSIVESLYHTLSLRPHAIGLAGTQRTQVEGENENEIVKEIVQYEGGLKSPDIVLRLRSALTEDQELRELICSRAGERGYGCLLSTVESFIRQGG